MQERPAVFLLEHVSHLDNAALQEFLEKHAGLNLGASGVTFSRNGEHVFVNFNFEAK